MNDGTLVVLVCCPASSLPNIHSGISPLIGALAAAGAAELFEGGEQGDDAAGVGGMRAEAG